MNELTLSSTQLTARIHHHGAELVSLQTASGRELIWQADPEVWARHAPVLFPIVGRLKDDQLHHHGQSYPMSQHGFARDQEFELIAQEETACTFRLRENSETLRHFPFAFQLDIRYRLAQNSLQISYDIINPADTPLFASIGAHPAFIWPLTPGTAKENHVIEFSKDEYAPVRRLSGGLLSQNRHPNPVIARRLALENGLFEQDALIFDQLESNQVSYYGPGTVRITLHFDDFPQLGVWTKPGADFICIEPWQGYASPEEFDGEFKDKQGIVRIEPGEQRRWQYTIDVDE